MAREQRHIVHELGKASKEMNDWNWSHYSQLQEHRKEVVRPQLRAAYLLYAFVRGKKRSVLEQNVDKQHDWVLLKHMTTKAKKHRIDVAGLEEWLNES